MTKKYQHVCKLYNFHEQKMFFKLGIQLITVVFLKFASESLARKNNSFHFLHFLLAPIKLYYKKLFYSVSNFFFNIKKYVQLFDNDVNDTENFRDTYQSLSSEIFKLYYYNEYMNFYNKCNIIYNATIYPNVALKFSS